MMGRSGYYSDTVYIPITRIYSFDEIPSLTRQQSCLVKLNFDPLRRSLDVGSNKPSLRKFRPWDIGGVYVKRPSWLTQITKHFLNHS